MFGRFVSRSLPVECRTADVAQGATFHTVISDIKDLECCDVKNTNSYVKFSASVVRSPQKTPVQVRIALAPAGPMVLAAWISKSGAADPALDSGADSSYISFQDNELNSVNKKRMDECDVEHFVLVCCLLAKAGLTGMKASEIAVKVLAARKPHHRGMEILCEGFHPMKELAVF